MLETIKSTLEVTSWQTMAIFATGVYGAMNFLYKVAAENNCSGYYIMSFSGISVATLSLLAVVLTESSFVPLKLILILASINGLFFATGSICKIAALKHIPANMTFPVVKLNSVMAVVIAIVFFGEKPGLYQIMGILLGIMVIISLSIEKFDGKLQGDFKTGFLFSLAAACSTAISMTVGKIASSNVPKLNYIFVSYALVGIYSLSGAQNKKLGKNEKLNSRTVFFGAVIGSLNLLGYFLVLSAFGKGPMSGVQPIFAMSIVIPIILSRIFYGEKLNKYRTAALFLSLGSVILLAKK